MNDERQKTAIPISAQERVGITPGGLAQSAQHGAAATAEVVQQASRGMTEQAQQVASQFAEAAGVYRGVAERLAEQGRVLARVPMATAGGMQEASRAWADWLQRAMQANARLVEDMLRARSLPDFAQVHARFLEESFAGLHEGSSSLLRAASKITDPPVEDNEESEGPVTVAAVMTRDVRIARPDQTAQEVASVMARADTGVLPVGEDDRIVGMVTDRDIAVRVVAAGKDPTKTKVEEAMTPGVEYCFEDEEIDAAVEKMAEQRLRRLPVLNREKRLVGILSLGDLATEQPDPAIAGRALGGIAQEGGPHRQRLVSVKRPVSRQAKQRRH